MESWVKIYSKMLKWEWYTDTNTKVVFLHCLLKANFEEKEWRGMLIERGQFEATVSSIAGEINLTPAQVRISLNKLKNTGEIAIKTTNKFSIITICNYESYQSVGSKQQQTKRQSNVRLNSKHLNSSEDYNLCNTDKQNSVCINNNNNNNNNTDTGYPSLFAEGEIPQREPTEMEVNFQKFQKYVSDNCPNILRVQQQLTLEQFKKLKSQYTGHDIESALLQLGNWPDFHKKRISVYLSLLEKLKNPYGERNSKMG